MAARAAAFSDSVVREVLGQRFVPVAENCSHLQRQQDAEGDLFRLIAEQGHYGGRFHPTDTRQGMYAAAPDGTLLGSCNVHGAQELLHMLDGALQRWEALRDRPDIPLAGDGGTDARYARRPPEGGLILRIWARDLPRDPATDARRDDWRKRAFNLDHVWLTAAEVAGLVPQPAVVGAEVAWPEGVVTRLARCHLVDNVRGETPAWRPDEVEAAALRTRVTGVQGQLVDAEITGHARLSGHAVWREDHSGDRRELEHGLEVALAGRLQWDRAAGRLRSFSLAASGTRWGATQYNSRGADVGPAPIGFAFELAGPSGGEPLVGDETPPQLLGAAYFGARRP